MILPGLLTGYLTLLMAGFGIALLISKGERQLNLLGYGCLSWIFGAGAVSLLLWVCGSFVAGAMLQTVVTVACVGLLIVGWRTKQRRGAKFTFPLPQGVLEWLLTGLVTLEIATIFFVSFKNTLGWDGLLNWEIKARYAFMNGGLLPSFYYSNTGRSFSHPEYPLGIPYAELWLYLWMGQAHQFWVKTIFPIFYGVGSILLALFSARLSAQRWSGLIVAALVPFIPYLMVGPGGVIFAYADFPLSVFYLAALGYLLHSLDKHDASLWLYAACIALLPWMKREGLILWCVMALLGLVSSMRRKNVRAFLWLLLPGLLVIASWRIYLALLNAVSPSDFSGLSFHTLHANRFFPICERLFAELTAIGHWSIFWLLAGAAMVYLVCRLHNMKSLMLAGAVLLPIILYCLTYLFSAWSSYTAHITASLPRLLLHVVPVAWLTIGVALPFARRQQNVVSSEQTS